MKILTTKVTGQELAKSNNIFDGPMTKGVVDVSRRLLAIDAPMHADLEKILLDNGSNQDDLWGINLYFEEDKESDDFIEFDSMINIRPRQNNRSRSVEDPEIKNKIKEIVAEWMA